MGAFLMKTLYQGDLVVSAMFLTATAPNPLVAEFARQGSGITLTWTTWALAACVPGIVGLVLVPYVVYRLCPPETQETKVAQSLAAERLEAMGPLSRSELIMVGVFSLVLLLWLSGEWHGISATTIACLGLALLLLTRVLEWQDVLDEKARMGRAHLVRRPGDARRAAGQGRDSPGHSPTRRQVSSAAGRGGGALSALVVVYVYSHYAFASLVAHTTAMFPAFFAVAVGLGAPPLVAALALGSSRALNAAMTHYGTGPAPIVFAAGYLTQAQWWRVGFLISLVHLAIWLPIGFLWWKMIGLW